MNYRLFLLILFLPFLSFSQQLPVWNPQSDKLNNGDWLINRTEAKAAIYQSSDSKNIILYNGLLKRMFRITGNVVCIDFKNMRTGQQLLRAIKPEARITINNTLYNIGGLYGQSENAYLVPKWIDSFTTGKNDFRYKRFEVSELEPFLRWKSRVWTSRASPTKGKSISFIYESPLAELDGVAVTVHYELYDQMPLIVKWLSVENRSGNTISIGTIVNESLALVEEESAVVGTPEQMKKQHGIYIETNYAFNNE